MGFAFLLYELLALQAVDFSLLLHRGSYGQLSLMQAHSDPLVKSLHLRERGIPQQSFIKQIEAIHLPAVLRSRRLQ